MSIFAPTLSLVIVLMLVGCNPTTSNVNLIEAAKQGDVNAQFDLGWKYSHGEGVTKDYQQAANWYRKAAEQGLAEGEWIFIYHDNPEITAPQQCRTDICVTVPAGTKGSGNVEIQQLVGGRYGQSRFTVTDPAQYPALWQQHIGEVVAAGFEFDDRPCFELYHSFDPVTKVADVSFCSSLKG